MEEIEPVAHVLSDRTHSLRCHLEDVAKLAASMTVSFGANEWAYLAGLWHDIGKYSTEFQSRIRAAQAENAHVEQPGRVDHSSAGAQYAFKTLGSSAGKVLAYVIAGHHSGLPDGISTDSCLRSRLSKAIPDFSLCPPAILDASMPTLPFKPLQERIAVQLSMFIRMLYSALVDADFLDTESFMDPDRSRLRSDNLTLSLLMPRFFEQLAVLRNCARPSDVNRLGQAVLSQCLKASERDMGLFSLTVPTGGGKTLSSLAFALRHAQKHNLKRIIYVIPFTSIIEQNADVFRKMLGDGAVLEHHSNFEPEDEDHRSRLASENWDAPIIVTTNVQFFESLFANRSSRCRKLHNIAESVVILDEVQTLPAPYLLPCLEVLKELTVQYKTSIVLCSATQPAIHISTDFPRGLAGVHEMIDDTQGLATHLKRTQVEVMSQVLDTDLAERLARERQVLCIVNTRKHARKLYELLKRQDGVYHLSALMCPVHRTRKLNEIRDALGTSRPCRVISTQLVEAGVDIDFPVVYRSLSGIDSIAQAAGRCNREGRLELGEVYVFTPEDEIPAGHFRQVAQAAESVMRKHGSDMLSLAAIGDYFRNYYWSKGEALDQEGILQMLQAGSMKGDFPFKTIAETFQFIKDCSKPVIIPFDDMARELIQSFDYSQFPRSLARKLQKYTVSIPPFQWQRLLAAGALVVKADLFPVLTDEGKYNYDVGLSVDESVDRSPESLYV